jgi:hypothetical protein
MGLPRQKSPMSIFPKMTFPAPNEKAHRIITLEIQPIG